MLSYGQETKTSQLTMAIWYKDTANHMDAVKGTDNKGFIKQNAKAKASHIIDMIGKLHVDMNFQECYVPSGVNVKV